MVVDFYYLEYGECYEKMDITTGEKGSRINMRRSGIEFDGAKHYNRLFITVVFR